ncbi:MAG TPA: quinone-dependent dihydroorotate dehydrogenase [Anaeromyxobacteraceae bacterium]|jgi:dihydroorotate dehydrogenase|nr:quinone-dependent dihydroorotate dehydrogenase [Anaeromyxobacteraceae bacterium]
MLWPAARSLLFRIDPERVHGAAIPVLRALGRPALAALVRPAPRPALATRCLGLDFANPLGLAAGFDKGEVFAPGLFALGFGSVEIGTITPVPQAGNPRPRLFRLPEHGAILNRMGFNNDGAEACAARLAALTPAQRPGVLGVNIGKNKVTPNEEAEKDYLACIDRLHPFADYLVVNLSSPNTPGLRELQGRAPLERLLGACMDRLGQLRKAPPLLVKLAPDLAPEALDEAVEVALAAGVQGLVATNTTIQRPGPVACHPRAGEAGGLSGAPLEALSTAAVKRIYSRVGTRIPVIGVGGVMTAAAAYAKIRAGSSLVQAYTGFIYGGPRFAPTLLSGLEALLKKDGFGRLEEAIGIDCR